jgi:glycosyltransferase involved in cell wall biosynthesis
LVFDVDDAIWLAPPDGKRACIRAAQCAEVVLAGNQYIADWFSGYSQKVEIVPTAVDADQYRLIPRELTEFTIGWIGTSSNLRNIENISDALVNFFRLVPTARLLVVSDRPPRLSNMEPENVVFIPWRRAEEVQRINSFDVGIMPLSDDAWSRGKCSFKMLQYMACEVPCVASPIGMNYEVMQEASFGFSPRTQSEWLDALVALYEDASLRQNFAANGRALVLRRYSRHVISARLARIFRSMR